MATELKIPKLGMAMTEGELVEWLVEDGAAVEAGQAIYVIESDKASQEIEATASGTLRVSAKSGETYEVGTVVGTIE